MAENLEYQARIKADTSELKQMDAQLKTSGERMQALSDAGTGLVVGLTGMKDALNGSVSGLLAMAYGAGTAWKALSTLSPVLKGIAIVIAAAQGAQILWSHFTDKAAKSAEEQRRAIENLGLELSDLEKHNRVVQDQADQFDRAERAAKSYADAIDRVAQAQRNLNQALAGAAMANLDLEEATALSDPNLTDEGRRQIQRKFINKKAEAAKLAAIQEFAADGGELERERAAIASEASADDRKRADLSVAVSGAEQLSLDSFEPVIAAALKTFHVKDYRGLKAEDMLRSHAQRDPSAFLGKYAHLVSDDQAAAAADSIKNIEKSRKELSDYDAEAGARDADRAGRRDALDLRAEGLGPGLESSLKSIEAARINALNNLGGGDNPDPYEGFKAARDRYRYDKMSDAEKRSYLGDQMAGTRAAAAGETDDAKRGRLLETLVNQQRELDNVNGRLLSDRDDPGKSISDHKDAIEQLREYRSTQAMDVQGVFQHMYNVQAGKNPDEQVADNTAQIAKHMESIQKILEGAASA